MDIIQYLDVSYLYQVNEKRDVFVCQTAWFGELFCKRYNYLTLIQCTPDFEILCHINTSHRSALLHLLKIKNVNTHQKFNQSQFQQITKVQDFQYSLFEL